MIKLDQNVIKHIFIKVMDNIWKFSHEWWIITTKIFLRSGDLDIMDIASVNRGNSYHVYCVKTTNSKLNSEPVLVVRYYILKDQSIQLSSWQLYSVQAFRKLIKLFFFLNFLIGCIYMCVIFSFIMPCWHITYLKHNNRKLTVLGFTIFRVILLSDFSIRFSSPSSPCPIMSSYMYLSILVPASQMCKFTVSINCRKLFLLSQTKRNYWNTVKYKYVHARYICACK